ncbi:rab effector Noc2 isoform X4 [Hirundo rustica]|uniref:rab effector Noc2 isoform X4 n=1 Tax=Hirundo rustica TaxID=43150 RepID=UPI002672DEA6|nr:rab effector Noc2 isoform X4 [Hirundo rustica]
MCVTSLPAQLVKSGVTPATPPLPRLGAMADMIFGSGTGAWVCPNDRQLALRAKLQTGWSVHTFQSEKQRKMQALSPKELEVILGVIRKAEKLDAVEQQRIGRLVERLENMRKNAMGNGLSQCLLCGETLGLLGSSSVFCQDCKKVWKRSGAWFYRGLPKYIRPLKSSSSSSKPLELQPQPWQGEAAAPEPESVGSSRSFTWARGKVVSSDSESDSELSSSSLEDKPVPVGSKGSAGGKLPAGMAPTRGPGQARSRALGTPQSPRLSGSHSSLGSEQESGQSDQAWDRRHSDAATGTPAAAEWGCQKVTLCGSSGRLCTFRTPRQEQFWLHIITSGLEFLLLLKRFLEVPALM